MTEGILVEPLMIFRFWGAVNFKISLHTLLVSAAVQQLQNILLCL